MKDIKGELRNLLPKMKDARFERLWANFEALANLHLTADQHIGIQTPRLNRNFELMKPAKHRAGYRRRFENLRSAISALTADDKRTIWVAVLDDDVMREQEIDKGLTQPSAVTDPVSAVCRDHLLFFTMVERLRRAAESCSHRPLNPSHRPPASDLPMLNARDIWLEYVKRPIGTNETGPFARFAKLFFQQIDPLWGTKGKDGDEPSLKRRIRKAREVKYRLRWKNGNWVRTVYETPTKK